MEQKGRPGGLSFEQKRQLWHRWKDGQSLSEIARALGSKPGTVHGVIKSNGGIVPRQPYRSKRVLCFSQREEISRGLAKGESFRTIASRLGRSVSTISREVARNGGRMQYRAGSADDRAWKNAKRPKKPLLAMNTILCETVAKKLTEDWSPQQISNWLMLEYPYDETMRVSPETIYRSLFLQARGVLKKELISHLRRVKTMRSSIKASTEGQCRGKIIDLSFY